MQMYSVTPEDMTATADVVKRVVLRGLVADGLLDKEVADNWAGNHTPLVYDAKRGFFGRLFDKPKDGDGEDDTGLRITLVEASVVK